MKKAKEIRAKMVRKDPFYKAFIAKIEGLADQGYSAYALPYEEWRQLPKGIIAALEADGFEVIEHEDYECVAGHESYVPDFTIRW